MAKGEFSRGKRRKASGQTRVPESNKATESFVSAVGIKQRADGGCGGDGDDEGDCNGVL